MSVAAERVLVVDASWASKFCSELLIPAGYRVEFRQDGAVAWELLQQAEFDAVLTSTQIGTVGGAELVRRARKLPHAPATIVMSFFPQILDDLRAARLDADDYLGKWQLRDALLPALRGALDTRRKLRQLRAACADVRGRYDLERLVCRSSAMQEVRAQLADLARSDRHVLLCGEPGSGKQFVARVLYAHSERSDRPFVSVLGGQEDAGLERELFGGREPGVVDLARHGTLFFSDLATASSGVRERLLEILRGGERGGVRLMAATRRQPDAELSREFGADIVRLPNLTQRVADVPELVKQFLNAYRERTARDVQLDAEAFATREYRDNLRGLRAAVEHAALSV